MARVITLGGEREGKIQVFNGEAAFREIAQIPDSVLSSEYVSSFTFGPTMPTMGIVKRGTRRLSPFFDDLNRKIRWNVYEDMMLDGQVKACVGLLIAGIVGGGIDIMPASDTADPNYARDVEVALFCQQVLMEHCETSFIYEFLPDMLKAIAVGHRMAEKIYYKITDSPIPGKYVLKRLKVKPRRACTFVVDEFMNVVGIANTGQGFVGGIDYEVLDRDKFAILTWKPTDSDPRGTSDLRSVYEPWWRKQRYRPQHMRYLDQFASPSLIGELSEGGGLRQQIDPVSGQPKLDGNGLPVFIDRSAEMLSALQQFQNSSIIVIPNGATIHVVEVSGDGAAFLKALDSDNMEIAKSILFATLATEQGPNQGRAAASVHQDVVSVNIDYGIGIAESMIRNDILAQLVSLNYPAGTRVPRVRLPGANQQNFLEWASAISKLQLAMYLDPSQYPGIDARLGLPRRSDAGLQETIKSTTAQRELAGQAPPLPGQKTAQQANANDGSGN